MRCDRDSAWAWEEALHRCEEQHYCRDIVQSLEIQRDGDLHRDLHHCWLTRYC
ncbi:hypothetical protein BC826DRAFT_1079121 [Russula brevipes]|nr:hypothetical protein BC826DRAFT_1079121 [Russula brevipes]